ncbi:hypothetical protein GRS96_12355 [Rathayibacter sp. VKM Ac-2803]|uniref:hypothetical protein n=1 Tax=Rathayibacter sp. VKM Ac-2803 TaxID=2609256 RepID=UPI0013578DC8|nr:hypothetical protein [Rathayibacter sp. VKM Ac-2803]MWV50061.1 hypothetical protein [Rathayibacter sp. VKM Ac-2803]
MTGLTGLSQLIDTTSKKPRPDQDPNWYVDADILLDQLVTLRFRAIDPEDWARRTYDSSPRADVPKDKTFEFNVPEVCAAVARVSSFLVDDDTEERIPPEMWDRLWPIVSAPDKVRILDAVFLTNQWGPQKATLDAKKARLLTLAQSADSLASSESPLDDSADGNRETSSTSNETSTDASADSSSPANPSGTTAK